MRNGTGNERRNSASFDAATVDRLIRAKRWDAALAAMTEAPDPSPDIAFRRRRRMVAAMAGRLDLAISDAEAIAAAPEATAEDWAHLAHVQLRDLRFERALAAAAAALQKDPGLIRAWRAIFAAAALRPDLTARAAALIEELAPPPSPAAEPDPPASGAARKIIVALPWRLPAYAPYSGAHPVIASIFENSSILEARWTDPADPPHPAHAWSALPDLAAWAARRSSEAERRALAELLFYRIPMAFHRNPPADFVFHHTVPFSLGPFGLDPIRSTTGAGTAAGTPAKGTPWVFHLEQLNSLHAPIAGYPHAVIRFDAPWAALLADVFRARSCLGVVTHIRRTAEQLRRLFPEPEIQAKLAYIPLGVDVRPAPKSALKAKSPLKTASRKLFGKPAVRRARRLLLFTNSHGADNFFLRGGADVLAAADALRRRRDDFHVLIRSAPPDMPSAAALARWRRHPAATWIDERLSETEIDALYRASDMFLLPSGILHAVSLTRALRCGLAVVATDALGVDEFIRHGVNGLVTPGRRALTARDAPGVLIDEDYRWLLAPSPSPADGGFQRRFVAAVERLLDDAALEARLRQNAASGARRRHDGRRWAREVSVWARDAYLTNWRGESVVPDTGIEPVTF